MQKRPPGSYCGLDQVRLREGAGPCRELFQEVCARDKRRAAALLNDRRLTFPCLYILSPQIGPGLYPYLCRRNAVGLRLIEKVQNAGDAPSGLVPGKTEYTALRWILESGYGEDGMEDAYDEILEIAVSVLIGTYRDTGILPLVSDMIFARNREGRNIHDLTWAFFNACHPSALKLTARRIRSGDGQDAALACDLLGADVLEASADPLQRYEAYLKWLSDNDPYLYFTGESMQYASAPAFCRVDLDRKFMQRGAASYQKKPLVPADREEEARLRAFQALPDEEKNALAEYSHRIHARDALTWKQWMRRPLGEQIRIAKTEGEGTR